MSDTPRTDVLREVVIGQYKEDELTGNGMGNILSAFTDIETLERERDEQARLLGMSAERECDLRGKLERERALADRLASVLQPLLIATWREKQPSKAELAFTAWKEARND